MAIWKFPTESFKNLRSNWLVYGFFSVHFPTLMYKVISDGKKGLKCHIFLTVVACSSHSCLTEHRPFLLSVYIHIFMCLCIYMKSCFQNGMQGGDPNCLGKIVYLISYTKLKTQ